MSAVELKGILDGYDRAQAEQELKLHGDSMALVLELDRLITEVDLDKFSENKSVLCIKNLCESVNKVIELAESSPLVESDEISLIHALRHCNRIYPEARLINGRSGNRLSVGSVVSLFNKWAEDISDRPYIFWNICNAMVYLLENFFVLMEGLYTNDSLARQWNETYTVYIERVNQVMSKVPF